MKKVILPIVIICIMLCTFFIITTLNSNNTNFELKEKKVLDTNYFVMYSTDDYAGVIDKLGNVLVEPKYADVFIPNQSKDVFFCVDENGDSIILNKDSKEIFTEYEEVTYFETSEPTELVLEESVLRYKADGLYGIISLDGEKITEPIYEMISSLKNKPGKLLVKQEALCGVIDIDGTNIIPIKYDSIVGDEFCLEKYAYNLAGYIVSIKTETGVMYGYLDYSGKEMLKTEYETISRVLEYDDYMDIYLVVRNKGKKGVFKNGKQIIDFNYQQINYNDKSNVFAVQKNKKYGFFKNDGTEILEPKYTEYQVAGNYISVEDNGNYKLYDLNGNLINKDKYLSMIEVEKSSYFIAINEEGHYSIISKDTQIEGNYAYIAYAFDDNYIFVTEEGKCGVLNVWKGTVIEPTYDSILNVENTKVLEARNVATGELDIYNSKLEKVSTIVGGIVENVEDSFVVVYSETEMKYFDKDGNFVDNTQVYKDNALYAINQDGKWGFANKEGKIIVDCEYDIVTELNEFGFAGIKKDGKWGVIDKEGNLISDAIYDIETYYFPNFVGKYQIEYIETRHCLELK